jgi:hypothetical protein
MARFKIFFGIPALEIPLPDLILGSAVLDSGFPALQAATAIHVCSDNPTTYAQVATLSLGSGDITFGNPSANGTNRRIASGAITGSLTGTGTAQRWAIVDADSSALLATGALAANAAVESGKAFSLEAITIDRPATS